MTFDEIASVASSVTTWLESFATTPREKIDLEGMAALARIAGTVKTALAGPLSTPATQADLSRVGAMIKQDMPSLTAAPATPAEPEPAEQNGVRGGARGGLMEPGT